MLRFESKTSTPSPRLVECKDAARTFQVIARAVDGAAATPINEPGRQFLNRLSDYLFVLARHIARLDDIPEVLWQKDI